MLLLPGCRLTGRRRKHMDRRALIHTTTSHEHHATLHDMALRTNERMVLDARGSVSLNVRQDHQLGTARSTTHRLHSD